MPRNVQTIGIIGAGKLGVVLSQLAIKAGYHVNVSGSGDPGKIKLTFEVLSPGTHVMRTSEVAKSSDVIVLALPLGKFRNLSPDELSGKIVIDATNYWWVVDGPRSEILPDDQTSSRAVQEFLSKSTVVKAISHLSYHELYDDAKIGQTDDRKAIAVASDDNEATEIVSKIIENIGFEPLPIGGLDQGRKLEPGSPAFGASLSAVDLRKILND